MRRPAVAILSGEGGGRFSFPLAKSVSECRRQPVLMIQNQAQSFGHIPPPVRLVEQFHFIIDVAG